MTLDIQNKAIEFAQQISDSLKSQGIDFKVLSEEGFPLFFYKEDAILLISEHLKRMEGIRNSPTGKLKVSFNDIGRSNSCVLHEGHGCFNIEWITSQFIKRTKLLDIFYHNLKTSQEAEIVANKKLEKLREDFPQYSKNIEYGPVGLIKLTVVLSEDKMRYLLSKLV